MNRDIKVFSGVMDADTESRFMKDGNYRYLLNARNTINTSGKFGSVEDVMGNILIDNPYLSSGTNKCVGTYEDIAGQSCIYLVWNDGGYHGIYRWYANRSGYDNGVIEKIYQISDPSAYDEFNPDPLGFKQDKLITGIDLVGDLLFWVQEGNDPKELNIARANETNKKRKFNLYFNKTELVAATYTIDVYQQGNASPVYSFNWSDTDTTVAAKVKSFVSAVSGSATVSGIFSVTDNVNYVTIEMAQAGVYYLDFISNGGRTSKIIADNFYPDFITGIPYSYEPLKARVFNRVKCPPQCNPDGVFQADDNIIDPTGIVTAGDYPATAQSTQNNVSAALGYWIFKTGTTGGISYTINLTYTIDNINGGFGANFILYLNSGIVLPPGSGTTLVYDHFANHGTATGVFNETITFNVVQSLNAKHFFVIQTNNNVSLKIQGDVSCSFTYNGLPSSFYAPFPYYDIEFTNILPYFYYMGVGDRVGSTSITNNAYMFRAKYTYLDYENSVYSGASNVVIPYNSVFESIVRVNFTDEALTNTSLSFHIKDVTLASSIDGGITWADITTLSPYSWQGDNAQYYEFTNKELRIAIDSATALLEYHDVPLSAKSQAFIDSRIFDGGMVKGYDKVKVQYNLTPRYYSLTDSIVTNQRGISPEPSLHLWKRGWEGYVGVVYYDDADRKSGVCLASDEKLKIAYYNDTSVNDGPAYVDWAIYNEPPDWATKYRWVRSNNLAVVDSLSAGTNGYLMWLVNSVQYTSESGAPIDPAQMNTAKYCVLNFDNIAWQASITPSAKYGFTFTAGDVVRIISSDTGTLFPSIIEYEIKKVQGGNVYIENNRTLIKAGFLVEIYSPQRTGDDIVFYEFGECFEIESAEFNGVTKKYHKGSSSDQSFGPSPINTVVPATGTLSNGDVYYFDRAMVYSPTPLIEFNVKISYITLSKQLTFSDTTGFTVGMVVESPDIPIGSSIVSIDSSTKATITEYPIKGDVLQDAVVSNRFGATRSIYVSSPAVNDTNEYYFTGNYRVNIKDLPGRTELGSSIDFSDQWLSDKLNGLCAVQPANNQQYDTVYGQINKLAVVNNDVLKLIFGNSYQLSVYVNQGIIRQTQGGDNIISQSDQVAGNSHLVQRTLGTTNAECVVLNDEGDVMGYDENEGVAWRASGNGLVQISDYFQKSTFKGFSNSRRALGKSNSFCPSVYDLYHDEYIITLGGMSPQEEILPVAHLDLQNLDPTITINFIKVMVHPNNTTLYNGGISGVDLNTTVANAVVAYGQGWDAVYYFDGSVDIVAPNVTAYSNAVLQVMVNYNDPSSGVATNKTYSANFTSGQLAGTGVSFQATTIAFSKSKQGWSQYYSFTPEFYGRVRDYVVSFKDGKLWLHDKGAEAKNFYGDQYSRILKYVSNKDFPKVKQYKALSVNGIGRNSAIATIEPYEGASQGMLSYVPIASFKVLEGIQYAAFLRDRLTPNFTDQAQAMLNGRQLKGQTVEITLQNQDSSKSVVYSSDVVYFYSEHS